MSQATDPVSSPPESTSSEQLRPLTRAEQNILYMLTAIFAADRAARVSAPGTSVDDVIEAANAVMQVEGLLDRLIRTGRVSPVLSTLERCVS